MKDYVSHFIISHLRQQPKFNGDYDMCTVNTFGNLQDGILAYLFLAVLCGLCVPSVVGAWLGSTFYRDYSTCSIQ